MRPVFDVSSFRDPSGFIFRCDGELYRQINRFYQQDYELLMNSGLYKELTDIGLLVSHEEVDIPPFWPEESYKIIKPKLISFISYPYEWCFGQLKLAALATLTIQKKAIERGMTLKDASAYNIQFFQGRPVLIDTLSFEKYEESEPWAAYCQFCQHFLAPLALICYCDNRLRKLLRVFIDGLPLDLTSKLLPLKSIFNIPLLLHIRLHAKSQQRFSDNPEALEKHRAKYNRLYMLGVIDNLYSVISKLNWQFPKTEWGNYSEKINYSVESWSAKKEIVKNFIHMVNPSSLWDIGSNSGEFSKIASKMEVPTIGFDLDPVAVEKAYLNVLDEGDKYFLPLMLDINNPSPSLGWANSERLSIIKRGPADMVMALAFLHHLAIGNNLPFPLIAEFFASISNWLIIEFAPKSDSQVKKMLASRRDIFNTYDHDHFEKVFMDRFIIEKMEKIQGSERSIYLMRKKK